MKRIGIVTTWFERGAGYVSRQYKEILQSEFQVFIYARGGEYPKNDPFWNSNEITWGKKNPIATTAVDLGDFNRWLDKNHIDIVIFNEQKWWDPIQLCNKKGILNGAYIDYYTEETIPIFGLHDFLICNTQKHFQAFEWHRGAKYISWGTDISLFSPERAKEFLKREFPELERKLQNKVVFFQSVGVVPLRKGTDLLIQAFSGIDDDRAHLLLHSQISIAKTLPDLREKIDNLVEKGRLTLIEKTVSAPGLYAGGSVYVYPSRLEGIGLTVPEALSCGLPVIVPDDGPMNEFPSPDCGILVPPKKFNCRADAYYWPQNEVNPEELRRAMLEYLDGSRIVKREQKAARKHAEKVLDWNKNATLLIECIHSISPRPHEEKEAARQLAIKYNRRRKSRLKEIIRRIPLIRRML